MPNSLGPTAGEAKQQLPEVERRYALMPSNIELKHHLGVLLFSVGRVDEAIPLFEECYNADRSQAVYAVNLANAYKDAGKMDKILDLSRAAYEKDGGQQWSIKLAYSEALMRLGHYQKAWPIYESGRFTRVQTQLIMNISETVPEWKGQKIDTPLLVMGEGGWGDRINYSRFLPWVSKMGVQYHCLIDAGSDGGRPVLADLFKRIPWINRSLDPKEGEAPAPINFTHWVTLFSLMCAFDICPEQIPPPVRWYADPERVKNLQHLRSTDERPTVGLIWSAGEAFEGDRKVRSLSDWDASRLVALTEGKVHWVNLQYGPKMPNMAQPPYFENWEDTAAAIDICDLVVSVDTGPMHLANSLGKPVWLILSGNSDWKWMLSGQSPWYKEMRIFRNNGERGYNKALAELTSALQAGEADSFNESRRLSENVGLEYGR
jgi:hypothetical protein